MKKTYLIVHGAWHGQWCLDKVSHELKSSGHDVLAIDLLGSGEDKTPMVEVSVVAYLDKICTAISDHEHVIVVGHPLGGISITQAGERCADKIKTLVYLTAILPENGESVMSRAMSVLSSEKEVHYEFSSDGLSSSVKPSFVKDVYCGDCTDKQIEYVQSKLTPQANGPLAEAVKISESNYGSIPRYYIEYTLDNEISINRQREMYDKVKCKKIYTLNTSHSPFISVPKQLAKI